MGIAADRDSNIPVNLIAGIGQMPVIGAPIERAPTPAVGDLMKAFRDGFITVADIQKRQADMPVEASNRALQLQANDFKSKRLGEAETMAPATLALERDKQRVDATRLRVIERNLNAAETAAPALEKYEADKRQHMINLVSPDENIRAKAHEQDAKYKLEEAYISTFGESPEFIELNEAAKPLSYEDWAAVYKKPYVDGRIQDEIAAANVPPTDEQILTARGQIEAEFTKGGADLYDAYKVTLRQKNGVAYRGTPDYYKALNARMTAYDKAAKTQASQFKVFEESELARAKESAKQEFPDGKEVNTHERENRTAYAANPAVKAIREVAAAFSKIESAVTGTSDPFKDMSAIFGFMKTLDPGSTVREGEYATAQNARGWPETIKSLYNKAVEGIKLTPDQRTQIFGVAKEAVKGQIAGAAPVIEQYLGVEARVGAPAGSIVPNQDRAAYQKFFGDGGIAKPAAPGSSGPLKSYESGLGQFIELKDGRKGILTQNPDGTFSLK